MFLRLLLFIYLITPLASSYSWANSAKSNCQSLFLEDGLGSLLFEEINLQREGFEVEPTVKKTLHVEKGKFGGTLYRLKRVGLSWASNHTTMHYDPQGDPRWFIQAFGEKYAQYFGFKVLSESVILVPDAVELSRAIQTLNPALEKLGYAPIPITFHNSEKSSVLKKYLANFAERGSLPIAQADNHFIHDISYHSGSILMAPLQVKYLRSRSKFFLDFSSYAEEKFKFSVKKLASLKKILRTFIFFTVENVDNASAFQGIHSVINRLGISTAVSGQLLQIIKSKLGVEYDTEFYKSIQESIYLWPNDPFDKVFFHLSNNLPPEIKPELNNFSRYELITLFKEYSQIWKSQNTTELFQPGTAFNESHKTPPAFSHLDTRLIEIQKAINSLD